MGFSPSTFLSVRSGQYVVPIQCSFPEFFVEFPGVAFNTVQVVDDVFEAPEESRFVQPLVADPANDAIISVVGGDVVLGVRLSVDRDAKFL